MLIRNIVATVWTLALGAAPVVQPAWICSVAHVIECNSDRECTENPPDLLADLPGFYSIDLDAGIIAGIGPSLSERSAPILHSASEDGRLTLAGVQGGRGWSLALTEETGEAALAISDPDGSILVFGRCMEPDSGDRYQR